MGRNDKKQSFPKPKPNAAADKSGTDNAATDTHKSEPAVTAEADESAAPLSDDRTEKQNRDFLNHPKFNKFKGARK